jgi:NAD(P)-dependent dehydrogenase (short-subunit alcohol dehydrogenase family)
MTLRGRWALVTGAARRVGRVVAHELASRGANVIVHYHTSAAEASTAVASLRALGVEADALAADLADATAVRRLAADAEARSGGIAVLVNSASNYLRTPFDAITEADWDASLDVNLKAPFVLAWTLGRAMRARGDGVIVNVADWAGERPYRDYLPYCVSKAGLIALTKSLAMELAPAVRVNAVAPGPVLLPEHFGEAETAAVRRATPLARIGAPEDVARAIRFLAEEADFSTGSVLHVDGGRGIA